jgi:hypothetical protein
MQEIENVEDVKETDELMELFLHFFDKMTNGEKAFAQWICQFSKCEKFNKMLETTKNREKLLQEIISTFISIGDEEESLIKFYGFLCNSFRHPNYLKLITQKSSDMIDYIAVSLSKEATENLNIRLLASKILCNFSIIINISRPSPIGHLPICIMFNLISELGQEPNKEITLIHLKTAFNLLIFIYFIHPSNPNWATEFFETCIKTEFLKEAFEATKKVDEKKGEQFRENMERLCREVSIADFVNFSDDKDIKERNQVIREEKEGKKKVRKDVIAVENTVSQTEVEKKGKIRSKRITGSKEKGTGNKGKVGSIEKTTGNKKRNKKKDKDDEEEFNIGDIIK